MIENQYKHLLKNARSYQGTLTTSEHRIVIITLQIDWYQVHKNKNIKSKNETRKFNTQKLLLDKETQDQ